jgi:hypothetical protein
MARKLSQDPAPPLLAFIEANRDEERHAARRKDAEEAIARLYAEQADLLAADQAAPAEIGAANVAVIEAAAEVADIEEKWTAAMEADPGGSRREFRQVLADARSRLVDSRSVLDQLTRQAAERARRLSQITPDIESWDDRRHQAGLALLNSRRKRGAVST